MAISDRLRRRIAGAVAIVAGLALLDLAAPPPLEKAAATGVVVEDHAGRWLHAFPAAQGRWRFEAEIEDIDPVFVERLIAIEDKRFYRHPGVDARALLRAAATSARAGEIVSGGSTITMQTARLLEPRPRNIFSKVIEIIRALQIERRLSKDEILELYLTLAPYGGNIEGVRAASLIWFDKEPTRLTDAEQALLIALPQAPEARRPDRRSAPARKARADILAKLAAGGHLTNELADDADAARLPAQRHTLERFAYHAAYEQAQARRHGVVQSTIDRDIQIAAERLVRRYAGALADGATASLVVVEANSREVRAVVGSSGLDAEGGWLDLTAAIRSPGSALKPFIYAMALEDGLLSAETVIDDMPRAFGSYAPENFDRTFRGEVRMREALQHSLNVPAVTTLDAIGARRFAAVMNAAGAMLRTPETPDRKAGLALALGGAGISARDIATLYTALANDGAVAPLRWTVDAKETAQAYHMMSAQTAGRISTVLAAAPSLAGRAPAALTKKTRPVAFKTGTSYGFRDAWAAGHDGAYVVVAWVGRADGAARPGETGRKAAAPLLFDVFDMLAERADGAAAPLINAPETEKTTPAFQQARFRESAPQLVFPRDGVDLFLAPDRGFSLAARGGAGDLRWYVDGDEVRRDQDARVVWTPQKPGFYNVAVYDAAGASARARVRVLGAGG